ncbi:arylsulfatase [Virgibacillus indicus]|uniref:Arylsulfatase n=1 Tax=Virgibacillus indicus TaxID=2024554 RepID=A0A265N8C7_9BACI|nr:sulfatase-like hydrolase/transferase [Virgibacillus indicus]OZU88278.1 arylsulfatase [Virgibacillus indicus]
MVKSNKKQPNVIVFFTDQQRWDTTGVHGNPLNLTPNFDRMAQKGTHVQNSFTCQPVCGPARSCFQTGLYATASGCYRNGIPLPKDSKTLAQYFNESGYDTAYIGKWHLASENPVTEPNRGGYQNWLASNVLEFTSDAYHTELYNNANEKVELPGYRVDALTDAAIRYIDEHKDNPFFLFLSYIEPHHQNHSDDYPAPDGYAENYVSRFTPPDLAALGGTSYQQLPGYYGMVKRLDEALGRLHDALKSLNLSDDTIVLFTSDHANHFKTRNSEYKRSAHDSSIRVPTAITGPGFENGKRLNQMISLIDFPPTLLDAAGITVPPQMQGRSIVPLLRNEDNEWPEEVLVQISETQVGRAIRTKRWKYAIEAPDKDGWDDSSSDIYIEKYLYDLESDPYELTNLAGHEGFSEIREQLKAQIINRMVEAGENAPVIKDAPLVKSGQRSPDLIF